MNTLSLSLSRSLPPPSATFHLTDNTPVNCNYQQKREATRAKENGTKRGVFTPGGWRMRWWKIGLWVYLKEAVGWNQELSLFSRIPYSSVVYFFVKVYSQDHWITYLFHKKAEHQIFQFFAAKWSVEIRVVKQMYNVFLAIKRFFEAEISLIFNNSGNKPPLFRSVVSHFILNVRKPKL